MLLRLDLEEQIGGTFNTCTYRCSSREIIYNTMKCVSKMNAGDLGGL